MLDRLAPAELARVLDACERVALAPATTLARPGDELRHAYFPTESSISSVVPMEHAHRLEVSLVGHEGVHGVAIALGESRSAVHAVVQGGGDAWRMDAPRFRDSLAQLSGLRECVLRYASVAMAQLMQAAACGRFHRVEQRVARWLLMSADRNHGPTLHVTHETLAAMLGVRRVGVTEAASALQARGLIVYLRGAVTVRDRRGLERAACSCYRSDLSAYRRAFV